MIFLKVFINHFLIVNSKNFFVFCFSAFWVTQICAQITVKATQGIASENYTSLQSAFNAINAEVHTGAIQIELSSNVTETSTAVLYSGSFTSVLMYPHNGDSYTIAGNFAGDLIRLDGASNVTIDGMNTLTLLNLHEEGVTLKLANDASNNLIQNCFLFGNNQSTQSTTNTKGVISFGDALTTGNNNNIIKNCKISGSGATPTVGVWAYNSNVSVSNSNNTIENCKIFDYFTSTAQNTLHNGGLVIKAGNSSWTIKGNSFYQTVERVISGSGLMAEVVVDNPSGNNFIIENNYIGGNLPQAASGTMVYSGGNSGATENHSFLGIYVNAGNTLKSEIKNNTIKNIRFEPSGSGSATYGIFSAIFVAGNTLSEILSNEIGSQNTTDNIVFGSGSGSAGNATIIRNQSSSNVLISGNTIGGISRTGNGSGYLNIIASSSAETVVQNNTIGSTSTAFSIKNNAASFTSAVYIDGGQKTNVLNNTIANIAALGNAGFEAIKVANIDNEINITGNQIFALSSVYGSSNPSVHANYGIYTRGKSNCVQNVSGNSVFDLKNTSASAAHLTAIDVAGGNTVSPSSISGNMVHSLALSSGGNNRILQGISIGNGSNIHYQLFNNVVHLGFDADGNSINHTPDLRAVAVYNHSVNPKILFNTLHIGGNVTVNPEKDQLAFWGQGWNGVMEVKNNIFSNERNLQTWTTGNNNYAAAFFTNPGLSANTCHGSQSVSTYSANIDVDYNMYWSPNYNSCNCFTGSNIFRGMYGSHTLEEFYIHARNFSGDNNSVVAEPNFINKNGGISNIDLRISTTGTSAAIGAAYPNTLVSYDYNMLAKGAEPDLGAYQNSGATFQHARGAGIKFSPLAYFQNLFTTNIHINQIEIFSPSGLESGADAPRIYYRKGAGSWQSAPGVLQSSNGNLYIYNFAINPADMGGLSVGDVVYYMIVAKDNYGSLVSVPEGAQGSTVDNIAVFPSVGRFDRFRFEASNSLTLSGVYTVGYAGSFGTLQEAFNAYQNATLAGPVTFMLTDQTYNAGSGLTFVGNPNASAVNTLTLKPEDGGFPIISGNTSGALLTFSGFSYFTIDGSHEEEGTSRNMSIINHNTGSSAVVVRFTNAICGGGPVTNSTIKNTTIRANSNNNPGVIGIYCSGTGFDNNSFVNNRIIRVGKAIYLENSNTNYQGITIAQNTIGSFNSNDFVGVCGIEVGRISNSVIEKNTVFNIKSSSVVNDGPHGILIAQSSASNIQINNNLVFGVHYTGSDSYGGKGIRTMGSGHQLQNNVVHDIAGQGNASANRTRGIHGIYVGGTNHKLYHNTVYLSGNYNGHSTTANISSAIYVAASGAVMKNNIFHNQIAAGGKDSPKSYAVYIASSVAEADYNNYYVSGNNAVTGFSGTDYATLDLWKQNVGFDANTTDINAGFLNTSLTVAPAFAPTVPLPTVGIAGCPNDFGNTPRGVQTTKGAWEYAELIWQGNRSNSWLDEQNWSTVIYPGNGTVIRFSQSATNDLHLDSYRHISTLHFNGSEKKLVLGIYDLMIDTVYGPSQNSYLQTNSTGAVKREIDGSEIFTFPVGNSSFNPIIITNNNFEKDIFALRVLDEVFEYGTNGQVLEIPRVKRTWLINKNKPNIGGGVNFEFFWNPGEESDLLWSPFMHHYDGMAWANEGVTSHTKYSLKRIGYTGTFSPFSIADIGGALPVELLSFEAKSQSNSHIQLNWTTVTEINNDGFEIQRSENGVNFETIGWQEGAGNYSGVKNYSFNDYEVNVGNTYYYRLKQLDFDGDFEYSKIVSASLKAEVYNISLYPNPTQNVLYVKYDGGVLNENNVYIVSSDGRKINTNITNNQNILLLDVSNFSSGIYYLRIVLGEKIISKTFQVIR
jgi:trimeric autotransporter adhesin